jgi:hypothetical protein
MHGESVDDALNELAAALDVEPSAQLAARVRTQVGPLAVRDRRWRTVALAAAFAGIATAAASIVSWSPYAWQRARLEVPARRATGHDVRLSLPRPTLSGSGAHATKLVIRPREEARQDGVLVPPDQARALRALLVGIRAGRVSVPSQRPAPVDIDGLLLAPEPLRIPLIEIEPIPASPADDSKENK